MGPARPPRPTRRLWPGVARSAKPQGEGPRARAGHAAGLQGARHPHARLPLAPQGNAPPPGGAPLRRSARRAAAWPPPPAARPSPHRGPQAAPRTAPRRRRTPRPAARPARRPQRRARRRRCRCRPRARARRPPEWPRCCGRGRSGVGREGGHRASVEEGVRSGGRSGGPRGPATPPETCLQQTYPLYQPPPPKKKHGARARAPHQQSATPGSCSHTTRAASGSASAGDELPAPSASSRLVMRSAVSRDCGGAVRRAGAAGESVRADGANGTAAPPPVYAASAPPQQTPAAGSAPPGPPSEASGCRRRCCAPQAGREGPPTRAPAKGPPPRRRPPATAPPLSRRRVPSLIFTGSARDCGFPIGRLKSDLSAGGWSKAAGYIRLQRPTHAESLSPGEMGCERRNTDTKARAPLVQPGAGVRLACPHNV
jgi:hypothetical protein